MSENEERAVPSVLTGENPAGHDSEIHIEERSFSKCLRNFGAFMKRDWGRILLGMLVFAAVSAVVYFSANTTDSLSAYTAEEYEVGQCADKTVIATKSMKATAAYPVEIEEGEKIIKKGFPISEEGLLKLRKLSDVPVTIDYRTIGNSIFFLVLIGALWIVLFSPVILGRRAEMKELILESVLFIMSFCIAAFAYKSLIFQSQYRISVVITSTLSVFLVAILFGQLSAFLYTFVLASGIFVATGFQPVPFIFTLATGLSSARIMRKISKRTDIVFASILQAVLAEVFIVVLKVIFNDDFKDCFLVLPGVALNAFASGIFVLGLLTPLENLMNTASVFRLMDLNSDTNTEVLQKMQIYALGTYSHSTMVAQLAEAACKKIGANALLARVASLYHDIGKIEQPEYFTENQEGETKHKHDSLSPAISASIIKSHVKKGVDIAKKLHLPRQVIDIIEEHHGNGLIAFFYAKAKEADPNVSVEDFSYSGHPPVSRESAVVMLADTVEAACRSLDSPTPERLEKFIQTLIDGKINGHQLDDCGLTFRELTLIKKAFLQILTGHYHSRIKYPNQKDPDEPKKIEEKKDSENSGSVENGDAAENAASETAAAVESGAEDGEETVSDSTAGESIVIHETTPEDEDSDSEPIVIQDNSDEAESASDDGKTPADGDKTDDADDNSDSDDESKKKLMEK